MPRLVINEVGDQVDPNNYGVSHSYMNVWDGNTDLEIEKEEQNKRWETQQQILDKFAGMVEGFEKYTLLRKKTTRACSCAGGHPLRNFGISNTCIRINPKHFLHLPRSSSER